MFGLSKKRFQRVIISVVFDSRQRQFLLVWNPRWKGYGFSTARWPACAILAGKDERETCEANAVQGLEEDLGQPLPDARAMWIERLEMSNISGRTGQTTDYVCDIVAIDPQAQLDAGSFASPRGLLLAEDILRTDPKHPQYEPRPITWTTWTVLAELLQGQSVAVAVIARRKNGSREYLMLPNRYGQFFFPAKRLRDHGTAVRAIVGEFPYAPDHGVAVSVHEDGTTVGLVQETSHLGMRTCTFLLHATTLLAPGPDRAVKPARLEAALGRTDFRWFSEADVQGSHPDLSPTVKGLKTALLALPQP